MAEDNIGLGEAISGGTRLSGDFGQPITRGLQLGVQNEWQSLQREQQAQARLQRQSEEMAKFTTFNEGKWETLEMAGVAKKYLDGMMPKMLNAFKSGDRMLQSNLKNEAMNTLNMMHTRERQEKVINNPLRGSTTGPRVKEIYGKGGIDGLVSDNELNWYAPKTEIKESGDISVINVADPKLEPRVRKAIDSKIGSLAESRMVGNFRYVDKESANYKKAKGDAIQSLIDDQELKYGVIHTRDFEKHYQEYIVKNNIPADKADDETVDGAFVDFVVGKVNILEPDYVKYNKPPKSGGSGFNPNFFIGGKNKGNWVFTKNETTGFTRINAGGRPDSMPILKGTVNGIPVTQQMYNLEVKYIGNGNYEVIGEKKSQSGKFIPFKSPLIVDETEIENVFELTEEGKREQILGKKPKAAGAKAKPSKWDKNKR